MVWHNLNLITAQSCDFVFSSCPISAYKFQEIGIDSMFVPIECNDKLLKDYGEKKIYDVLHFGREKTNITYFRKTGEKWGYDKVGPRPFKLDLKQISQLNNDLTSKQSIIDQKNKSISDLQKNLDPISNKINELEAKKNDLNNNISNQIALISQSKYPFCSLRPVGSYPLFQSRVK